MIDPICYILDLDTLTQSFAWYKGPNGSAAAIDRAAWEGQGRPIQVRLEIGGYRAGS